MHNMRCELSCGNKACYEPCNAPYRAVRDRVLFALRLVSIGCDCSRLAAGVAPSLLSRGARVLRGF